MDRHSSEADEVTIKVKKLDSRAIIHDRKHEGDAGFDLSTIEDLTLPPHETGILQTGLQFEIPRGYTGLIMSRSSMAKAGLIVLGGVIDSSYEGPTMVIVYNTSMIQTIRILAGERPAQILFMSVYQGPLHLVT